jgi:hypothetical protein
MRALVEIAQLARNSQPLDASVQLVENLLKSPDCACKEAVFHGKHYAAIHHLNQGDY